MGCLKITYSSKYGALEEAPIFHLYDLEKQSVPSKKCEKGNHLGNVLTVVSDKPLPHDNGSGSVDYFLAEILQASDYSAFGVQLSGRNLTASNAKEFRYGFQNQEEDDEIKGDGNSCDFGARHYDPRLGRFLSIDSYTSKFAYQSPYVFAGNTPIGGIDVDGDSLYILVYAAGDDMFEAAALTRQYDITHSSGYNAEKDKVVLIKMEDVTLLESQIENTVSQNKAKYGPTVEFGVYSHAGGDGPVGTVPASNQSVAVDGYQMNTEAWSKIDFNWSKGGSNRAGFYGCNTANPSLNDNDLSFAYKLSLKDNFKDVLVLGQSSETYPSIYPNLRNVDCFQLVGDYLPITYFPMAKEATEEVVRKTYMVGGNQGDTWNALSGTKANPMRSYKNGKVISYNTYQR